MYGFKPSALDMLKWYGKIVNVAFHLHRIYTRKRKEMGKKTITDILSIGCVENVIDDGLCIGCDIFPQTMHSAFVRVLFLKKKKDGRCSVHRLCTVDG